MNIACVFSSDDRATVPFGISCGTVVLKIGPLNCNTEALINKSIEALLLKLRIEREHREGFWLCSTRAHMLVTRSIILGTVTSLYSSASKI